MNLSPHFTYEELTTTSQRDANGVMDNTPSSSAKENLVKLANNQLEQVRYLLGPMHVNSAYRSPAVNAAVKGASTSQHVLGLACDFVPLSKSLKEAYKAISKAGISFDQLIFEFGSWIHISRAPEGKIPRQQTLMIGKWTEGAYLPYDESAIP